MNGLRGFPRWEELYRNDTVEKFPWYWPALDPDLEAALVRYGIWSGTFLDLGTGPGTQAVVLAERGFHVTASRRTLGPTNASIVKVPGATVSQLSVRPPR
jgi:hypothetical protein